jgi:hypothetical protein
MEVKNQILLIQLFKYRLNKDSLLLIPLFSFIPIEIIYLVF